FIFRSSIPKKEDVKLKWFDAIGREVSKNRRVCSKHFHEHCIFYTCMKNGSIKRCSRPGAIPYIASYERNVKKLKIFKKNSESGEVNQKRRRLTNRYVGDFCRDDFTSNNDWKLFRKYYEKTSQKLKVFQARDRRC
ncbi:uncharacterized protein LOC143903183, partial [Temnothorax americanus]|uniref:uncharacterized protein LOC143903183 n=1 Tax=Temnothorax americanus TaxID=1964332 RepID=UPI00406947E6